METMKETIFARSRKNLILSSTTIIFFITTGVQIDDMSVFGMDIDKANPFLICVWAFCLLFYFLWRYKLAYIPMAGPMETNKELNNRKRQLLHDYAVEKYSPLSITYGHGTNWNEINGKWLFRYAETTNSNTKEIRIECLGNNGVGVSNLEQVKKEMPPFFQLKTYWEYMKTAVFIEYTAPFLLCYIALVSFVIYMVCLSLATL